MFKASYKLPGQVARQVASGKLTGQVGKLQVARSSCQQVGNLPGQVDKLPAMGGTGDHELNSGFFTTSCPAPCFNIAGRRQTSSKTGSRPDHLGRTDPLLLYEEDIFSAFI